MPKQLLLGFTVIAALLVAACGAGGTANQNEGSAEMGAEPRPETINVVMHDIYYGDSNDNQANPPVWTVTSQAQVTVNMDNQGALQHNWAIVKPNTEVPSPFVEAEHRDLLLFDAGVLDGGTQASATFTAPEPGEYLVICTVAGHYPLMQGRLVVR